MKPERVYDRLFPLCSTINQLNRVHILLENRMTPQEASSLSSYVRTHYTDGALVGFRRRARARFLRSFVQSRPLGVENAATLSELRYHAVNWAVNVQRQLALAPDSAPSHFTRTWLRGGALFYSAGTMPACTLTIGFTGNAQRLMMPTPLFLQHLHSFGSDLLLLQVPRGTAFVHGVRGFSTDFPGTVQWLQQVVTEHRAARVVTVGTSGGAFPAILAGLALGADGILAVGTRTRRPTAYAPPGIGLNLGDMVRHYQPPGEPPTLHLMHGSQSHLDAEFARSLAPHLGYATIVAVDGAGHGCMYDLVKRRQLVDVLGATLFSPRNGREPPVDIS